MTGPDGPVVVRHRLLLRLAWVPLFFLGLSSWAGLVTSAVDGFPGLGWDALVVIPLGAAVASAFTYGAIAVWRFRQVVTSAGIESRGALRTRRIEVGSAVAIEAFAATGRAGGRGLGGLAVGQGEPGAVTITVSLRDARSVEAVSLLLGWAAQRPDLVAGDAWARELASAANAPAGVRWGTTGS